MDKINIFQQRTLKITSGQKSQSVELDANIIEAGFLHKFPGSTLAIFLYLVTHFDKNQYFITTDINTLAEHLPYEIKTIENGLEHLEKDDIIMINHINKTIEKLQIYFNFEKLAEIKTETVSSKMKRSEQSQNNNKNKQSKQNIPQPKKQDDFFSRLEAFIPEGYKKEKEIKVLKQWLQDFEQEVLEELIRRVEKWRDNNNQNREQCYHYLKAIINDWYDKEIYTYKKLQHFDRMFRETRELAKIYGIKNWNNVTSVHMNTFKSWLSGESSLSMEVAKFAIKTAIKRKSDGQPSLKYIEDNFINPWKKASIKTVKEARKYLHKNRGSYKDKKNNKQYSSSKKENNNQAWENFPWQIDKITQGGTY